MKKNKFLQCPNCGYIITSITKKYTRYNYDCPKCEATKIKDFIPIKEKN